MKKNHLNERELAIKMGVNYTTVYRVLKGDRNPGSKFVNGLLNACEDLKFNEIFLINSLPDGKRRNNVS